MFTTHRWGMPHPQFIHVYICAKFKRSNKGAWIAAVRRLQRTPRRSVYGSGRTYNKGYNYQPECAAICVLIFKTT